MIQKWKRAIEIFRNNGVRKLFTETRNYTKTRLEESIFIPIINNTYSSGVDMAVEDWDHLLILDACRADMFEEVVGKVGDSYQRRRSNGSATPEWIKRTFASKSMGDTVYVSANPWVSRQAPDSFHDIINLWVELYDLDHADLANATDMRKFDFDYGTTIPARDVTNRAIEVAEEYPNKRIIVHYFQPHAPCIGLRDGTEREEPSRIHPEADSYIEGDVSKEELWEVYCENTGYAWHHAQRYLESVSGKKVVTADHGELFGELLRPFPMRRYAHPDNLHHPKLTTVPWAEFEDERREIEDDGCNSILVDKEIIETRLKQLGYQ
ncbi:hypothetical protein [Halohasta salina]|uniref:hypothetical protein n=1 Tax=Halohasta salina TaxID=2961621 RepID=UPI0020A36FA4|nr:hypothetical protein [Halohasta salina]